MTGRLSALAGTLVSLVGMALFLVGVGAVAWSQASTGRLELSGVVILGVVFTARDFVAVGGVASMLAGVVIVFR
jgi:uncharacterized membrane protein